MVCSCALVSDSDFATNALRTVQHSPHKLETSCLDVSLFEATKDELPVQDLGQSKEKEDSSDQTNITIVVSGILPSQEALSDYFENKRKSGGGEISEMVFNDEGNAVISFAEVKDLKRLLEGPHFIDDNSLTVMKKPRVPLDPLRIHVKGLNETRTSKDHLKNYLEKFADTDVADVYFGCNNNALVTFETQQDFGALFDKVKKDTRGLQGCKLELERVPICKCIKVSGLKKETSKDAIELYFESEKKAGGNRVIDIKREENSGDKALIIFHDPSSVQNVVKRSHVLDDKELVVEPYYPFLEKPPKRCTEVTVDAAVFDFIKKNHDQELQAILEECEVLVEVTKESHNSIITIFPSEKKCSHQLLQEKAGRVELFLTSFVKIEVDIAPELFDEIARRWEELNSFQDLPNYLVVFNAHSRLAQIVGKKDFVNQEQLKLKELINAAEKDTELMKSVVEVFETEFQRSRLILLKMSGICERLEDRHPHLSITFDVNFDKLCLKGPVSLLQEVRLEVYQFISKVVEQTVELSKNLINVLKRSQVSDFTQHLLKQKDIQAYFVYDEIKGSTDVLIVGVSSQSVTEAEIELKNVIQEKSLHLTRENALVLEGSRWKEFHSEVISKFKVGIFAERSSSTVWVSGIADDVEECYKKIKDFFDANTILHETLPLDHGTTRFIVEKWSSKLDEIKKDLATCYLDIKASSEVEGIEVSGTNEGLKKCISRLQDLAKAVQKDKVPIDKPGMKKFFLQDRRGPELLKTIEDSNHCVILTKERNENEVEVKPPPKLICSYLTQEGKTISVFKGDITNHRVDAIVNAANENLRHAGGLAGAIVRAGGQEIQTECNRFTRGGKVLPEGRALVTTAGKLPCDKVIHTVGPKWDPEEDEEGKQLKERVLKYAITNCLKEARSLRTIAIPAVSSGVYGFPRELCARVILDAVLDFCKRNPFCTLKEIHLVNIDDPTVSEFEKETRKRFAGEMTFSDNGESSLAGFDMSIASSLTPRSTRIQNFQELVTTRSAQSIRITVKVADLAKEEADILVGTAASSLNLEQNPCARALSKAAGPGLQQQCSRKGPIVEGDIAVIDREHKGDLKCQAVFFAVCSPWNNGRGVEVLKRLLTKCLEKADNQNMESIAFAAIGTGILQFPRDKVAEVYFDEVITYNEKNPKTTLKDVRFVLYEKDADTIQAFHSAEQKTKRSRQILAGKSTQRELQQAAEAAAFPPETSTFSPVKERKPDHLETTVGTLCFQVQPGDITQETTDAIALISDCRLDVAASAAGKAILQVGGNSIKTECSRCSPQTHSSVTVINAGELKARHLYLIVPAAGRLTPKSLEAAVLQCLQEAEKRSITSISFPAIGTGNLGISAKSCALSMLSATHEFSKQNPVSLKLIKMTIFQKPMIKEFRLAMVEESGEKPVAQPGLVRKFIGPLEKMAGALRCGLGGKKELKTTPANQELFEADNRKIDLLIVAGCNSDLKKASNAVSDVISETCKQQKIKTALTENLREQHMKILNTLSLRYDVKITVEHEHIVVDGQLDDIVQVISEIHEMLHEVEKEEHERSQAEVLSVDIQWMYKSKGKFEEYDSRLKAQIELAFRQKKQSVFIEKDGKQYLIDYRAMTQEDAYHNVTDVRRIDLRKDVVFPVYWCPQPTDRSGQEETVHLFQLDPVADAQEYKKVSDPFLKSCPDKKIITIKRVQNPALYHTYAVFKQRMEKRGGSNEMCLFHGTKSAKCELINHKGFNRSFCGENAAYFGNGVYFAMKSSYSARSTYSPPDDNGHRYMYLARVLVGEYTEGRKGLITPPPKNLINVTDTYDTVVDKIANPSIVVVFYDWQCYPEYLITFQ
ncbi:hypothetical protein ACROYT_G011259 [Oculina patagonica]